MNRTGLLWLLPLVLVLNACATRYGTAPVEERGTQAERPLVREGSPYTVAPAAPSQSAPVEENATTQTYALVEPAPTPGRAAAPAASGSAAVSGLLDKAHTAAADGQHTRAAAYVERALGIEPRNPVLWRELADIRLQQDRPNLAETLAVKSLALSGDNSATKADTWALIARIRDRQGDRGGAREARKKAQSLNP